MTLETAADRQDYMETFGVDVTVAGQTFKAIYDAPHVETFEVSLSAPQLLCAAEDAGTVAPGDAVTVPSASFTGHVTDVQADGTGMVLLILGRG